MKLSDIDELILIEEEERKRRARCSQIGFIEYVKPNYKTDPFHRILAYFLDKVLKKDIKNLIINAPPQHGKSEIVSRNFPPYALGRFPHLKLLGASYAKSLASEMCLDQQKVFDTDQYKKLFPGIRLPGNLERENPGFRREKAARRTANLYDIVRSSVLHPKPTGSYRAAGINVGITGRPVDIGLIDDPIKDDKEASSELIRENIWQWWEKVFRPRIADSGSIIITMTRWHENDLVGRLLELARKNPKADQWTFVNFEAIKEPDDEVDPFNAAAAFDKRKPGEALAPSRYSIQTLETTKESSNPSTWNALFRGRPSSPKGAIIKREWIRFYRRSELPPKFDRKVTSWDLRFKEESDSGDYVAGQAWAKKGPTIFLLGPREVRERLSFSESLASFRHFRLDHLNANHHLIENKANGPALENVLKKEISRLLLIEPEGGKLVRLQAGEGLWMSGNILLPHPDECPWVIEFIEEIVGFPKKKHDDRVDAASQAINFLDTRHNVLKALTKR